MSEPTAARRNNLAPLGDLDTRGLLARARAGDAECMGKLLALYRNYLTVLASTQLERRLRPRVSPSDVVQETMLQVHRHLAQFRGETEQEFLAWLRQVLLSSLAHFVERHLLAAKRNIRKDVSLEAFEGQGNESLINQIAARGETPSSVVQQHEAMAVLSARLAKLPSRYRDVLVLRHKEELSFDEIAVRLHRTPAAARMLWLRAIQKLRAVYGGTDKHDA